MFGFNESSTSNTGLNYPLHHEGNENNINETSSYVNQQLRSSKPILKFKLYSFGRHESGRK